ncbi:MULTISPECIES: hypothetical protein [Alistipes]|jgi:hypothetical protein|uniref:hypothetical protein n=2 Tax=Rikenellaceae TaxID=171550 RepID=UPI001E47B1D1|nr:MULTISPECIES: hypothetical protein [Alistipes]
MMKFVPKILLVAVLLTAYSCKRFPNPFAEHNTILAEVENKKLYLHDVSPIFTPNMTSEDSLKILRSYVDQWVKKQLKIKEAERMLEESQKDIDQMVQEYRNSLLTHKVDQFYVDKNIDTLFTDTQIADYYNQNKADFILDKTLVKARIVRIPRSYDKKKTIEELMLTPREEGYQDLLDLCVKNNFELTELNQWTDFAVLRSLLPVDKTQDYDYLLNTAKVNEFEANDFIFYVRVLSVCRAGEYAPQESVREVIKRVIFNKRKEEIIRAHEDSLYRGALDNKEIVVNVN